MVVFLYSYLISQHIILYISHFSLLVNTAKQYILFFFHRNLLIMIASAFRFSGTTIYDLHTTKSWNRRRVVPISRCPAIISCSYDVCTTTTTMLRIWNRKLEQEYWAPTFEDYRSLILDPKRLIKLLPGTYCNNCNAFVSLALFFKIEGGAAAGPNFTSRSR